MPISINRGCSSSSNSSEKQQSPLRLNVTPPFSRWKTVGAIGWGSLSVVAAHSSDCSDLSEQLLHVLAAGTHGVIVIGINRGQRSVMKTCIYARIHCCNFYSSKLMR
jgi:hypothetical protein